MKMTRKARESALLAVVAASGFGAVYCCEIILPWIRKGPYHLYDLFTYQPGQLPFSHACASVPFFFLALCGWWHWHHSVTKLVHRSVGAAVLTTWITLVGVTVWYFFPREGGALHDPMASYLFAFFASPLMLLPYGIGFLTAWSIGHLLQGSGRWSLNEKAQ
jgi:hypothetical protein